MTVDRTVIDKTKILKHRRNLLIDKEPEEVLDRDDKSGNRLTDDRHILDQEVLSHPLSGDISARDTKILEISGHTAYILIDTHLIIIKDNYHTGAGMT